MDIKSFKKAELVMSEIDNLKEVSTFLENCNKDLVKMTDGDISVYINQCGCGHDIISMLQKELRKQIASKQKEFAAIK